MASEYSLKLKATLDTAEVKAQLNQLRQQQRSALGGPDKGGNPGAGTPSGNLGGLTSLLSRLNQTLMNLNRTLQHQATVANSRLTVANQSTGIVPPFVVAGGGGKKRPAPSIQLWPDPINQRLLEYNQRRLLGNGPVRFQRAYGTCDGQPSDMLFVEGTDPNQLVLDTVARPIPDTPPRQKRDMKMMNGLRMVGGMAVHQIASMSQQLNRASGFGNEYSEGLAKTAGYVAMGSAAGPLGMVAGLGLGAAEIAIRRFTQALEESASQLDEQNKRAEFTVNYRNQRRDFKLQNDLNDAVKMALTGDFASLDRIRDDIRTKADANKTKLDRWDRLAVAPSNAADVFATYQKQLGYLKQIDDAYESIRKNAEDKALAEKEQSIADYEAAKARKYADDIAKDNWQTYLFDMKNKMESELAGRRSSDFVTAKRNAIQNLQDRLSNLKAPDMTQINSLASGGLMISKADDDIRMKMQFDFISEQTRLQREIRNKVVEMNNGAEFQ